MARSVLHHRVHLDRAVAGGGDFGGKAERGIQMRRGVAGKRVFHLAPCPVPVAALWGLRNQAREAAGAAISTPRHRIGKDFRIAA